MVSIPVDLSLKRAPSVVVIENNPLKRSVQAGAFCAWRLGERLAEEAIAALAPGVWTWAVTLRIATKTLPVPLRVHEIPDLHARHEVTALPCCHPCLLRLSLLGNQLGLHPSALCSNARFFRWRFAMSKSVRIGGSVRLSAQFRRRISELAGARTGGVEEEGAAQQDLLVGGGQVNGSKNYGSGQGLRGSPGQSSARRAAGRAQLTGREGTRRCLVPVWRGR